MNQHIKIAGINGALFGAILIPFSAFGLALLPVEVLVSPLTFVPRMLVLRVLHTEELPAIVTIGILIIVSALFYAGIGTLLQCARCKFGKYTPHAIIVAWYALHLLLGIQTVTYAPTAQVNPEGNIGAACTTHSECVTPMNYLIQSNCPYGAMCIEGSCKVVCQVMEEDTDSGTGLSYSASCAEDSDCDCSKTAAGKDKSCACVDEICVAIME